MNETESDADFDKVEDRFRTSRGVRSLRLSRKSTHTLRRSTLVKLTDRHLAGVPDSEKPSALGKEITGDMGLKCVAHLETRYTHCALTLREELFDPDYYDDGTYAPLAIRLALHAAGTYDCKDRTGGLEGACMRFRPEGSDAHNKGLKHWMDRLETKVRKKHPWITISDLWVLSSYVAIEASGGPSIEFKPGRLDSDGLYLIDRNGARTNIKKCPVKPGRLPMPEEGNKNIDVELKAVAHNIRSIFTRMGVDDRLTVALIAGGHSFGRCHTNITGYAGPWQTNPGEFNNVYCKRLLFDDWKLVNKNMEDKSGDLITGLKPKGIRRQYVNKNGEGNIMMLVSDMALIKDPEYRVWIEKYAKSEELLRKDFGEAFKIATEFGFTPHEDTTGGTAGLAAAVNGVFFALGKLVKSICDCEPSNKGTSSSNSGSSPNKAGK